MLFSMLIATKRMCQHSGWSISNLELQKLLYIAQMYNLGENNSPLFSGYFEAWNYGPVNPTVYHKVKVFGSSPIGNIFRSVRDMEDSDGADLLDSVIDQLGNSAPGKLVAITHWKDGAWAKHYVPGSRNIVIPNEDMRQEYLDRKNAI